MTNIRHVASEAHLNPPIEPLYSVKQVSETLGVTVQTLYNWNHENKFPDLRWVKVGSRIAMEPRVLRAFIEARSNK